MYIITRQYKTPKVVTEKKLRPSQHEYVYFFKLAHTCLLESAFCPHELAVNLLTKTASF